MTCKDCGWKSVNPSGAIFCGYTYLRTWEDESCGAWKPVRVGVTPYTEEDWKRTNADRIRSMSDEELAELFEMIPNSGNPTTYTIDGFCIDDGLRTKRQWLNWLRQEATQEI